MVVSINFYYNLQSKFFKKNSLYNADYNKNVENSTEKSRIPLMLITQCTSGSLKITMYCKNA